ncbi:MAG: Crp/Fnr family transcriptional regulator, partial [Anaerolineae bacterium]|nr:Crp/Fnr family transcriptional regulator [Anaerolineae bacterium]
RGYIDIFTMDALGQENILVTYGKGDVVGELALLDGQPRSATARANGPLRVMVLQRQHFSQFIQSRPKVILAVLQFLAHRVRHTTRTITGDTERVVVTHKYDAIDDTTPMAPQAADTISAGKSPMGVFGRLSAALDELEQQADEEKRGRK